MKHDHPEVQRLAAWAHMAFCLLNMLALVYHGIAVLEHKSEEKKQHERN